VSYSSSVLFALSIVLFFFFFNDPATTEIYTLSLHDALPILQERFGLHGKRFKNLNSLRTDFRACRGTALVLRQVKSHRSGDGGRSEEHTSELQSRENLVCRLLLEKKKKKERD